MKITPVILCGGAGTRLWPLSRKSYPKQFATLIGDDSLFQQTARRLSGPDFAAPVTVTGEQFRFIVTQQLAEAGIDPGAVLLEPVGRNTAPAVLAAALRLAQRDPDAILLISPSDHYIPDGEAFRAAIRRGVPAAEAGQIVTFGIVPDRAATAYGYLKVEPDVSDPAALNAFVEKPSAQAARAMIAGGGYLWNAGLFLSTAETLIAAYARHAPDILANVRDAIGRAQPDLGFLRLDPGPWADCEDISVDYAVMEKAENLSVVRFDGVWSDMGGWDAVLGQADRDAQGTATHGAALSVDCDDSLLRSENAGQQVVGLGLKDVIAIAMPDAVLVADRSRVSELGDVVRQLRAADAVQADTFPKDHRPWGYFETLIQGARFHVKRIVVDPGASLSLQSHVHRAEHWVVVAGTARVTCGEDIRLVGENESVFIPLGAKHRLENPGKLPVEVIEVQTGGYFGEDDILRYDDPYGRDP